MRIKHTDEVSEVLQRRAAERADDPSRLWGLSWGMPTLDQVTGGLGEKKLVVLISRPATGKSALAAKWALHLARGGAEVRIATYEMSANAYQHRMACFMSGVAVWRIDRGQATKHELAAYFTALAELARLPITYQESSNSFEELRDFFSADGGGAVGILDHIGLVPGFYGAGGYSNASSVSIQVSRLAHTVSSLIVLGHQNRASLSGEDKRPTPESVAGSDQITRDADLILGLYRADQFVRMPDEEAEEVKPGELLILKNRDGAARTIHLLFSPPHTDWREVDELNMRRKRKGGEAHAP